ncbi:Uncharacterized protein GBIM_01148 [Gryllus bimaculatus]|nr:Uncharacterized protein GBIM_01148 [Gryllus bimaculatus]
MSALWARWAPPTERARLASLAASGTNVGTVLVFFLSGALALHFGWASIFYVFEVHLLEVGHMGIMAAVPYVLLAASLPGAGHLSDMLVRKKLMSVTQARKAMLGGTLALQALLMLTVAHAASRGVVLGCVLAVVATGAFPRATLLVNHLDLSPRHAGLLMGVTNSLATLPGIISPVVTGFLVTGEVR